MLGSALRVEYERSLSRRLARDSRGRLYLLTLANDRHGQSRLHLRRCGNPSPRSIEDFTDIVAIGAPRQALADAWFAAGMVIDGRDHLHVAANTDRGASLYWTTELRTHHRRTGLGPRFREDRAVKVAEANSHLGDVVVAPADTVWLTWVITNHQNNVSSIFMGRCIDGRWRSWELTKAHGICPPSLLICKDGSFCLAWHDIREDLYCLAGKLADIPRRKRWKARNVIDRARRPAMTELDGQLAAIFENDGSFLDGIILNDPLAKRSFVTWPDERFIGHTTHSPQFSIDRYGTPWLFFVDSTRQCIFCARWLGAGWGPIQRGPAIMRSSPRFEDNHLALDRFAVEPRQGNSVEGMTLAMIHDGPPTNTCVSIVTVPLLIANISRKILFLDLREIQSMKGLRLRLNTARKVTANPLLQRTRRGFDADGVVFPRVLKERDVFRLWYAGIRVNPKTPWRDWYTVGYAESSDGIHFVRRKQRLQGARGLHPHLYSCQIYEDTGEPNPDAKYKALVFNDSGRHIEELRRERTDPWNDVAHGWLYTSPDGLRWHQHEARLCFPNGRPFSFVPQCLFRDAGEQDPARRFKAYGFASLNMGRRGGAYAYSPDGVQWTYYDANPVLDPSARCVPVVRSGKHHQIHDTVVWQQDGYYLALYQYQYDSGTHDVELAVSRDGERFVDVCPGQKVLALGPPKSWDSAEITPSIPVTDTERIWLYYGAIERHVPEYDEDGSETNESDVRRGIGLAALRLDGFTHLEPEQSCGQGALTTIPIRSGNAESLRINTQCRRGSSIQVEILQTQEDKAIVGYSRADAQPLRGDHLSAYVRWKSSATLPMGQESFRLRFHLNGPHARLYSFSFR